MDDIIYRDCPSDGAEIPVRQHQRKRWEDGLCVFCGEAERHKEKCPEAWRDVFQANKENVGAGGFCVKAKPESYTVREALSQRERNWHKKKIPRWFKRANEASNIVQLMVLTAQHGNLLASPKKGRHAMRSWLRMCMKWNTNIKVSAERARRLAAIRVDLDRLRKKGRKPLALLRWFAKQPGEVMGKLLIRHGIMVMRDMSLTANDPDSEAYKVAEATARFAVNIPPQPMSEAMSMIQKAFQEREARLDHKPLVIADPSHLSPEEVRAYWEREARLEEWQLEIASNPFPEPATPQQIQALDEASDKWNNILKKLPAFDLSALFKYLTRSKSNTSTVQSKDPKDTE